MKNNVVNKKQCNKYFFIVLAVVLLIAVMTLVSLFGSNKSVEASADTDYKYETYNQLIYTETVSASNGGIGANVGFSFWKMLNNAYNAGAIGASSFLSEYILKIDLSQGENRFYFNNDIIKLFFSFIVAEGPDMGAISNYFTITLSYSDTKPFVEYFIDDGNGFSTSGDKYVDFLGNLLFLTINNDGLFLSTCSYYSDNLLDNRSAYERSLEHVFFRIGDNRSNIYDVIVSRGLCVPYSGVDILFNNNCFNYSVKESLSIYNQVEVPVKEGYKFVGWYYDKDFTRSYNNEVISSDTELYAKFEPITYTVFFDTGAVEDPTDPNTSGLYDTSIQVPYGGIAEYTPDVGDNKHLLGWFYADGTQYMNTPIYEDTRLYAKWGAYITFDSNGGEEAFEPMVCELGQRYDFPKPTREEYDFLYWEPVDIQVWHDGDPILYDMDLVAVWDKNVFLVTFYVDDKIFAEVKVNKGERLFSVVTETMTLEDKVVVGYENINVATVAVAFEDFEVVDDMVVYLSDSVTEDSSNNSSTVGFVTKVKDFFSSVKDFFVKIGDFFKKIFLWFKNLFSGSSNVVDVQGEQAESSSAVSELGNRGLYAN